ncbi:MAG: M20/M25/M40 family metallo-hydrolase, partial [Chloroflexota bacterium]
DITVDEMQNVYGCLPGEVSNTPGLMLMAHTDTVFPAETDLTLQRTHKVLHGPGLGDNSIGVAGLLGLAHTMREKRARGACDLWFVATSREEGLGDLGGARLAYHTLREKIGMVINIEGLAYGYIYNAGIAVRRLHITIKAQGGHSWLHFGRASAIHTLMRLGATLSEMQVPHSPRTTFNIGMIEGGHSINSIATEAGLWLDLRSEETTSLQQLEETVRVAIEQHHTEDEDIEINVEVVGDRPTGSIETDHPLIEAAMTALEETGVRGTLQIGSTDGNIPLSHGCPTVTIGITRGGNAHRTDEFVEVSPVKNGLRQLLLLTLAAADHQATPEQVTI